MRGSGSAGSLRMEEISNFLVGAGAARCGCGNGVVAGTELGLAVCFEGDGSAGRALIGDRACPCP